MVGIDVSKAHLDGFCLASGRRLAATNDAQGIGKLALWLEPGSLVMMEASASRERLAHRLLVERRHKTAVVNALRVRQFAKASGLLAKTDRLDAAAIARTGAFAKPAPTSVRARAREQLAELLAIGLCPIPRRDVSRADRRRQLLAEIAARAQQRAHLRTPALIERAQAALQRLRQDKAELDRLLQATIGLCPIPRRDVSAADSAADPELHAKARLLQGTPGAGPVLIATLLAG